MAGIYYRSQATGNWSATATWYQYSSPTGWIVATDYPKTGDYVWIQSTHVVTYDATAISVNNGATFAQISNRIDANGSAIAQPTPSTGGVGALNATSGYIALSVASPTTIASTYYSVLSSTNSLFTITASSTFTFSGAFVRGTIGGFIKADTGSAGATINYTGNPIGGTGLSGQCFHLITGVTTNITGNVTGGDGATSYGIYIASGTQTINITGSVSGSDVSATGYGIASANTNQHTITVTGNVNSGQTVGAINCASTTTSGTTGASVTVNGNIRNYGLSGSTPTEYFVAIQARQVKIKQGATLAFNTTDGGAKDYTITGMVTNTAEDYWKYLTTNTAFSTTDSIGKLIKDNLNATISSRATQTSVDDIPTASENSTQIISDLNTGSTTDIAKRLRTVATVETTGDQLASYNT
jgi:hypothetical protein